MSCAYLAIAIVAEVVGTSALKASEAFTRLVPSMIVVTGYAVALIVAASAVLFRQVPDIPAIIGVALIVAGVAVVNTMSRMPVQ